MDLKFNIIEINFIKKIKSWVNKEDKYLFNLNTYRANYLKTIKKTLEREPL